MGSLAVINGPEFVIAVSWGVTGVGVALWIWSWISRQDAIRKLRLQDSGLVMVFSAILLRIVMQTRPIGLFEWIMIVIGPVFIVAALWRLNRTGAQPGK